MGPRAIVAAVAALSVLAGASPVRAASLEDCAQRVIRDWYAGGRIDEVYPLPCYREAIRSLPDDVLQYTDASHEIERALEQARRGKPDRPEAPDRTARPPAATPPAPPASTAPPAPPSRAKHGTQPEETARQRADRVPARGATDTARAAGRSAPAGRDGSVPYPLIALTVLASVLLASGLLAALARRGR